jgi:hypothetical protein
MAKGKHGHFQYYEILWPFKIIIVSELALGMTSPIQGTAFKTIDAICCGIILLYKIIFVVFVSGC